MSTTYKKTSTNGVVVLLLVLFNAIVLKSGYTEDRNWYLALCVTIPLLLIAVFDSRLEKPHMRSRFFAISYIRNLFRSIPRSIRNCFVETDPDRKSFHIQQSKKRTESSITIKKSFYENN